MTDPVQIGDATLYLGDCLGILPTLGKVDAVVTDPPYGLDIQYASFEDSEEAVAALASQWLPVCREQAEIVAFTPGKRNEWLYPRPSWVLAWCSPAGQGGTSWGFPCHWPILVYGNDPYLKCGKGRQPDAYFPQKLEIERGTGHPCPKPENVMRWLVRRIDPTNTATILDPFMGSGTTGVACAKLGRKFIGIEIEPKYFDIACRRIEEAYRQPDMFIEPPKKAQQEALDLG